MAMSVCYSVNARVTLWDMPARNRREYVAIRLSPEGLARVREFAKVETEGNVSQMVRKLLGEAIQHRDAKNRGPR